MADPIDPERVLRMGQGAQLYAAEYGVMPKRNGKRFRAFMRGFRAGQKAGRAEERRHFSAMIHDRSAKDES